MAKGGLLNQVPQVDLPTTMDCNVVSIGGQTPEEYANLIAQKVAGKSNPGEYGSGSIQLLSDGTLVVNSKIKYDGITWSVSKITEQYIYMTAIGTVTVEGKLTYASSAYNLTKSETVSYETSELRKNVLNILTGFSTIAKTQMVNTDIYTVHKSISENYNKVTDKLWPICLKNLLDVPVGKNMVNKTPSLANIPGVSFDKDFYLTKILNLSGRYWLADRYEPHMITTSGNNSRQDLSVSIIAGSLQTKQDDYTVISEETDVFHIPICCCLDRTKLL